MSKYVHVEHMGKKRNCI